MSSKTVRSYRYPEHGNSEYEIQEQALLSGPDSRQDRDMGVFRRLIAFIEKNLTWLQLITGGGLLSAVGWVSNLAAKQTQWVTTLGPYGVWLATLGGVLLAAIVFLLMVWGRYAWLRGSAMNQWREQVGDKFNPLENSFRNQRILLRDLVSPLVPVVRGKTFYDCELLGPGNVVVRITAPNSGGFANLRFNNCDWVVARPNVASQSFIILEDCHFIGGNVTNIMFFLIREEALAMMMPGMNWITDPPSPIPQAAGPAPPSP